MVKNHLRLLRIKSASLLKPVTLLAAQLIEVSIVQAPLIYKPS